MCVIPNTRLHGKIPESLPIYYYGQDLAWWHINMNHDALNRDDGSYTQEYLHLVGK